MNTLLRPAQYRMVTLWPNQLVESLARKVVTLIRRGEADIVEVPNIYSPHLFSSMKRHLQAELEAGHIIVYRRSIVVTVEYVGKT